MKNNKGILMPATLKIIIAVICTGLLIYLGVSLYGIFAQKSKLEQAESSLKVLHSEIEKVEKGEKTEAELLLESPNDWWVIAWPYKEYEAKPKQCNGDYCICICPIANSKESSLEECDSKGVCEDVSLNIKTIDETAILEETALKIDAVISLKIIKDNNEILVKKIK